MSLCILLLVDTFRLLFGVNEKLLIQNISGPVTKYCCKLATRVGQGLGLG